MEWSRCISFFVHFIRNEGERSGSKKRNMPCRSETKPFKKIHRTEPSRHRRLLDTTSSLHALVRAYLIIHVLFPYIVNRFIENLVHHLLIYLHSIGCVILYLN
jgi:hypothetical protein